MTAEMNLLLSIASSTWPHGKQVNTNIETRTALLMRPRRKLKDRRIGLAGFGPQLAKFETRRKPKFTGHPHCPGSTLLARATRLAR